MRVNERRAVPFAAVARSTRECGVAGHGIGAVDFFEMEIGESGDQARNASARSLHFDRHGDRVAVVFHAENYRQLFQSGGVHRLPEFAFAGGAVAERDVGDFIALEADVLELAVVCGTGGGNVRGLGMAREIASTLGATYGLQNLRSGRRRLGHDVQRGIAPVRRHLAPAGTGIVGRADTLQKHVVRLDAERQAQRAIAVVRIEPVVARLQREAGGHADGLVPGAGHLEVDFLLALEQDFPVVDAPGGVHEAVGLDELIARKSFIKLALLRAVGRQGQLGVGLCRGHPVPGS